MEGNGERRLPWCWRSPEIISARFDFARGRSVRAAVCRRAGPFTLWTRLGAGEDRNVEVEEEEWECDLEMVKSGSDKWLGCLRAVASFQAKIGSRSIGDVVIRVAGSRSDQCDERLACETELSSLRCPGGGRRSSNQSTACELVWPWQAASVTSTEARTAGSFPPVHAMAEGSRRARGGLYHIRSDHRRGPCGTLPSRSATQLSPRSSQRCHTASSLVGRAPVKSAAVVRCTAPHLACRQPPSRSPTRRLLRSFLPEI